jgi:hypothetical protein
MKSTVDIAGPPSSKRPESDSFIVVPSFQNPKYRPQAARGNPKLRELEGWRTGGQVLVFPMADAAGGIKRERREG